MTRLLVLALLMSTFFVFGHQATGMANSDNQAANVLIKCATCGVEFTTKVAAAQHAADNSNHQMVEESGNSVIKCSTCGVEFTSGTDLKQHLQQNPDHQGVALVKCSTCGVEFASPALLKEHSEKYHK